jgi:nucleotide-binding universal stress UspA family protein
MKILLPVDGSAYSDAAVEEVARRPWPPHSEVKAITAAEIPMVLGMEPWAVLPEYFENLEKAVCDAADGVIQSALAKLQAIEDKSLKISGEVIQGSPKQVIVEEAERWNADLVVIGSRGLGAWNRLLLGSISNSVVHHANCSVEIVRRPQAN